MEIPNHPLLSEHVDDTLYRLQESLMDDADDPRLSMAWYLKLLGYAELVQYARKCIVDSKPTDLKHAPLRAVPNS